MGKKPRKSCSFSWLLLKYRLIAVRLHEAIKIQVFSLHGDVSVDVSRAESQLQKLDRQARSTGKTLADLNRASARAGNNANKSTQQSANATARVQISEANRAARAQEAAAKRNSNAQQQAARFAAQAAQQQARAQTQAALQASRAQQQAARDAARVVIQTQRDATRAAQQAAREATRTQQQAAREATRAAERAARETIRAGERATREAQRQSRETARAATQAAREATRAAERAADATARAAREASRATERAAREATRTVEREARAQTRARLQADRELDRALARRERERAARRAREDRERRSQMDRGRAAAGQLGDRGSAAATGGGLAIAGGFVLAAREAIAWEQAFAGVTKTVAASDAELAKMNDQLREMATQIPVAATELAGIGASAGQLGIKSGEITKFTRVIADLGVATNLTSEQGATDLARFGNITRMSQGDFGRLGATITDLGNKYATTEREIVSMGLRIAGTGSQIGLTQSQIMGMAAALSDVGIKAEMGGTAISTIFRRINGAVQKGGETLETYAKVAGMSGKEFKKAFETDAAGAIDSFVQGLGKIKGTQLPGTFVELGMTGDRVVDTLGRLAGNSSKLTRALKDAEAAWEDGTALTEEARKRYETTASQIKIAENNFRDFGITVGTVILPVISDLLKLVKPTLDEFRSLSKEQQMGRIKMVAYAGAALLVIGRIKGIVDTVILMRNAYLGAKAAMLAAQAAGKFSAASIGASFGKLVGVAGPLALVAIAIAGFVVAFKGAKDAGSMSADALISKWGKLGEVWVAGGDALGDILKKLDQANHKAGDLAEKQSKILSDRMSAPGVQKAPKSDVWKRAHGIPVDGSHAGGLAYVPKNGYIAELHLGEAVLTKSEANTWRARARGLDGSIRGLETKIDNRVISRARSGTRGTDAELLEWRRELRNLKRDLAEVRREGAAADREARKRGKAGRDELKAAAKEFKQSGEAVQDAAEKTLSKLENLRDGFRGMFGDIQNDLLSLGVIDDPLGGLTRSMERLLKLGQQAQLTARNGKAAVDAYNASIPKSVPVTFNESGNANGSSESGRASARGDVGKAKSMFEKYNLQSKVDMTCADVASRTIEGLGYAIKKSVNAAQFERNIIAAGWERVDPRTAPLGSAVFKFSKKARSKTHAMMSLGNGNLASSSNKQTDYFRARGNERAYAPVGGGGARVASSSSSSSMVSSASEITAAKVELSQTLRDVLVGQTQWGLSSVRALGRGWGSAVRPGEGNAARMAMQTRIGRGEAEGEIAKLSAIFSSPGRKADVQKFSRETGIKPRWEKGWTRRDQAVDVLRQLANLEDARTNEIKAGLEAEAKRGALLKEQVASVKSARDEMAALTRENEDGAAIGEKQMAFLARGGGLNELDSYTARLQKVNSLWRDENSPVVKLFKAGRKGEANAAFATLMAQFDGAEAKARELEEFKNSIVAVGEALNKLPAFSDVAREPLADLQRLLDDGSASADDLAKALENLPEAVKALEAAAADNPALAAKFAPILGVIGNAKSEVGKRKDSEGLENTFGGARESLDGASADLASAQLDWNERAMSEAERLQSQAARELATLSEKMKGATLSPEGAQRAAQEYERIAGQWKRIVESSLELEKTQARQLATEDALSAAKNQRIDLQKQAIEGFATWKKGKPLSALQQQELDWKFEDAKAAQANPDKKRSKGELDAINRERFAVRGLMQDWDEFTAKREKAQRLADGIAGAFMDGFDAVLTRQQSFADAFLGSLQNMLFDAAKQVIQSQLQKALLGLLGGGVAAPLGVALPTGGAAPIPVGVHASGLERVPRDNYLALLHANEKVMSAAEAESWRQQQKAKEIAIVGGSRARGSGDGSTGAASQGGGSNDVHLHLHGPTTVKADDVRTMAGELIGQKLPRREAQRRAQRGMGIR